MSAEYNSGDPGANIPGIINSTRKSLEEKGSLIFVPREESKRSDSWAYDNDCDGGLDFGLADMRDYSTNNNAVPKHRGSFNSNSRRGSFANKNEHNFGSNPSHNLSSMLNDISRPASNRPSLTNDESSLMVYERMKEDLDRFEEDFCALQREYSTFSMKLELYHKIKSTMSKRTPNSQAYNDNSSNGNSARGNID